MNKFYQSSFIRFFTKFHKLILAGLMFSAPSAVFIALFALLGRLINFNNIIVWGLGLIPSTVLYSGLVMVVRKYSVEKQDVNVVSTFFETVKENCKSFLVHGVVVYLISACSFFALLYYYTLSQQDVVFGAVLTLYSIFTLLLIVMMFYVPIMTITYDLRLRDIYKNSFLLIFGKILRNLIALIAAAIITALAVLLLMFSQGIWFTVSLAFIAAVCPLLLCYITNSIIAKGLQDAVGYFAGTAVTADKPSEQELKAQSDAVIQADSNSDYVFVNGKMIKK